MKLLNLVLLLTLATCCALFVTACSGDDYSCDEATFERSCHDQTTVIVCTHGEIAHWECSGNQVCKSNTCEDP